MDKSKMKEIRKQVRSAEIRNDLDYANSQPNENQMDKIKLYNKIVDEISSMVWTSHYSLICDVMNKYGDEISEEDYDQIQDEMTTEIDNLLKRK